MFWNYAVKTSILHCMGKKRILIIGLVWPEPTSSAAGTRILQLVNLLLSGDYDIIFASAASKTEFSFHLTGIGVTEKEIVLNDSSFNTFLRAVDPAIVVFDRYMVEEQYGWRVQQECPNALRILDTEDLHCLRYARQQGIKSGQPWRTEDLFTDTAKREIAAILRCDLSLVISETEMDILREQFRIDPSLIYYLPFLEEEITEKVQSGWTPFEQREGFVFIGNFLHEPNWHTVQVLKNKIWPELKKKLPETGLHIYGAYTSQKVLQLHNDKERFFVHGRAADARLSIAKHRIMLAPIQFGAGLKGKFIDAMQTGTPAVTTIVGAEAMHGHLEWSGAIEEDTATFIAQAIKLYQDKTSWLNAQEKGVSMINERYGRLKFGTSFIAALHTLSANLSSHRQRNFFGQILLHHTANSTKYMSLWIEEKNRVKQ